MPAGKAGMDLDDDSNGVSSTIALDMMMTDEAKPVADGGDGKQSEAESRGEIEKRHHHELRLWRKKEKEMRRQMQKLRNSNLSEKKEKKGILREIKALKKALEERHSRELNGAVERAAAEKDAAAAAIQ